MLNEIIVRDGVIGSPRHPGELRVVAGAVSAADRLRQAGYRIFVVTNQPDVARGVLSTDDLTTMMNRLRDQIGFDDFRACTHDDADACDCRKPKPGMLRVLAKGWDIDLARSWMIGDTWKDIEAGQAAGCRTILLRRGYNTDVTADIAVDDLGEAADRILMLN